MLSTGAGMRRREFIGLVGSAAAELAVNARTAQALGLAIPASVRMRADGIIQ